MVYRMKHFLPAESLPDFIGKLMEKHKVAAPVTRSGVTVYDFLKNCGEFSTEYVNTTYPAKKFFLPAREGLLKFSKGKTKGVSGSEGVLLFGVRPCDINALNILDKLFLDEPADPYYARRRKDIIVVGLSCTKPGPKCFCDSVGHREVEGGYDLLLTEAEGGYTISVGSARGGKLLDKKIIKQKSARPKRKKKCKNALKESGVKKLDESLENSVWTENSEKCLSCGACTITCPTCGCFDVFDVMEPDLKDGVRERLWDSCQIKGFTRVAGGFVFRDARDKRMKFRVYHKLLYFPRQYGVFMCTGCARCGSNCPTEISMVKMVNGL